MLTLVQSAPKCPKCHLHLRKMRKKNLFKFIISINIIKHLLTYLVGFGWIWVGWCYSIYLSSSPVLCNLLPLFASSWNPWNSTSLPPFHEPSLSTRPYDYIHPLPTCLPAWVFCLANLILYSFPHRFPQSFPLRFLLFSLSSIIWFLVYFLRCKTSPTSFYNN